MEDPHLWISLNFRTDMTPSIDRTLLSSPKHAGARTSKRLFRCLRIFEHQALDVGLIAPVSWSGLLPPWTFLPLRPIPRNPLRQKLISLLPTKSPRRLPLNNNLQPLSFLWIRRRTPRKRRPTPPSLHRGYYFGRKVLNPEARRRRCWCVELLAEIRRTKGQRMVKEQTSRSPGS